MLPGFDATPLRREFKKLMLRSFAVFTAAEKAILRALVGAASSGPNSDITSLAGLTSGISGLGLGNKIQPITASVAANALTITVNPTTLDFRSATLGSGTVNTRNLAAAASLVISSGSTLGTVSATPSRIAVLLIDNAGTLEVAAVNTAGGLSLEETGLISTTAEGGAGGADSASVIYSTTARASVPYRLLGYVDSTQATAGTWATAPSTIQGVGGNVYSALGLKSMVRVNTSNGFGSTATSVRRFANVEINQGDDITYADSATAGGSFTIKTADFYTMSYSQSLNAAGQRFGISKNSSNLTTSPISLPIAELASYSAVANTGYGATCGTRDWLVPGTIIRCQDDAPSGGSPTIFTISRG